MFFVRRVFGGKIFQAYRWPLAEINCYGIYKQLTSVTWVKEVCNPFPVNDKILLKQYSKQSKTSDKSKSQRHECKDKMCLISFLIHSRKGLCWMWSKEPRANNGNRKIRACATCASWGHCSVEENKCEASMDVCFDNGLVSVFLRRNVWLAEFKHSNPKIRWDSSGNRSNY